MTTPFRTENATLAASAEAIGLRVMAVYHHPDDDTDTVFAECPSATCTAKRHHYDAEYFVTHDHPKCGCSPLAASVFERVKHIRSCKRTMRAWYALRRRAKTNSHLVFVMTYREFVSAIGEVPSSAHWLRVASIPADVDPSSYPLVMGKDLRIEWTDDKKGCENHTYLTDDDGRTMSIAAWSKETGVPWRSIRNRLDTGTFTAHEAVHTPVRPMFRRKYRMSDLITGRMVTIADWATIHSVQPWAVRKFLAAGKTPEEILDVVHGHRRQAH